jgi:glycerol-3-phosphate O-acyltransferase / dihydroxyacetone phosphate acyltransferase
VLTATRRLLSAGFRALFLALVRLYYPGRSLLGAEKIPAQGPVVLVANHPNGLLDPLVLRLAVGRPVRFLAKATFFRNPFWRLAMETFESIPVYRAQDAAEGAGDTSQNERTFALAREALGAGQWLALFPEGMSHSDPSLRPVKTGAARIALGAAAELDVDLRPAHAPRDVCIVPVGLAYADKAIFRSDLLLVVGRPIATRPYLAGFRADERAAVAALTEEIRQALDAVVLQAETTDLLEGVARVAAWTAADPLAAADPERQRQRARALLEAYGRMRARDPARVEALVKAARDYARVLSHLGVSDPWALEVRAVARGRALWSVAKLLVTAPFAAVGFLLSYLPYRLAGTVAARYTQEEDVLGTAKLLLGTIFVGLAWVIEVAVAGWWLGGWGALALSILAPMGGYASLRLGELLAESREARRHLRLRRDRPAEVARLVARRQSLAHQVAEALTDVQAGAPVPSPHPRGEG